MALQLNMHYFAYMKPKFENLTTRTLLIELDLYCIYHLQLQNVSVNATSDISVIPQLHFQGSTVTRRVSVLRGV